MINELTRNTRNAQAIVMTTNNAIPLSGLLMGLDAAITLATGLRRVARGEPPRRAAVARDRVSPCAGPKFFGRGG